MSKTGSNNRKYEESLDALMAKLQAYDNAPYSERSQEKREKKLENTAAKIKALGDTAVPKLIEVLEKQKRPSFDHAASILGATGDARAIKPLVQCLEHKGLGEDCHYALVQIGPACVPEIIKLIEYRIAHPVPEKGLITLTHNPLSAIGNIRCETSAAFLNSLLDDYMQAMPMESFDPTAKNWPYRNVDFFHLLDCMVRQQDKSSIPHIRNAQKRFPKNYTDYLVCRIAVGRIKKGRVEGYLPLEAMDISMPSSAIFDMFLGRESEKEDDILEEYREYLDEDDE